MARSRLLSISQLRTSGEAIRYANFYLHKAEEKQKKENSTHVHSYTALCVPKVLYGETSHASTVAAWATVILFTPYNISLILAALLFYLRQSVTV